MVYAVMLISVWLGTVPAGAEVVYQDVQCSGAMHYAMAHDMMGMINAIRQETGAASLTYDAQLSRYAMQRAAEISYYFGHTRPDDRAWSTVSSRADGENIEKGQIFANTSAAFEGWKNSPGHYANMISTNYKSVGIACLTRNGNYFWVQLFSREESSNTACPPDGTGDFTVRLKDDTDNPYYLYEGSTLALDIGESEALHVIKIWNDMDVAFPANRFNWTSSSAAVSVDQNGRIRAEEVGESVITASPRDGKGNAVRVTVRSRYDLEQGTVLIEGLPQAVVYTGEAMRPAVKVSYNGRTLREGVDYTVEYTDNTSAGSARVTVTGTGSYMGSCTAGFEIIQITDLEDLEAEVKNNGYYGSGSARSFVWNNLTLKYRGKTVDKTHFSLSNVDYFEGQICSFGLYMRNGFAGTKTYYAAAEFYIPAIAAQTYTGQAVRPAIRVYRDSNAYNSANPQPLKEGRDYVLTFAGNVAAGTAAVTITGKGAYFGQTKTSFTIKQASASQPGSDNGNTAPQPGKSYTVSGVRYTINMPGQVIYTGPASTAVKSVTIPQTVKIAGRTYKVTAIAPKAFSGCRKLTKVTIGANIRTIGSKAFYKCKSLKKITIKSKVLASVGSKAVYGIHKKAVIKVPKKQLKTYKKLFGKRSGFTKKMRITK